jgi:hypothetical protein
MAGIITLPRESTRGVQRSQTTGQKCFMDLVNTYLDAGSHSHTLASKLISLCHCDPVGKEFVHPAARDTSPLTHLLRAWDSVASGSIFGRLDRLAETRFLRR